MNRALACTCLLLLAPVAAADAAAAKPQPPQAAVFKATLRGSQVTTWSLRKADDPDDPCDASQQGDGSQMVRFATRRAANVALIGDTLSGIIPARVTVEREGDYKAGGSSAPECVGDAVGSNEGDDDLTPLVGPDCGKRSGTGTFMLEFGDERADDLTPLVRDELLVTGDLGSVVDYTDCPWWIGGPVDGPSDTELLPGGERVRLKTLRNRKRKVIKVSADYTRNYRAPGFTGKTLVTWNLTLRRVGR